MRQGRDRDRDRQGNEGAGAGAVHTVSEHQLDPNWAQSSAQVVESRNADAGGEFAPAGLPARLQIMGPIGSTGGIAVEIRVQPAP
jgi:hypothetical protein